MNNFFPLHVHSHNSLLDGLSKPTHISKRCASLNLDGCALTDHGTLSGAVTFVESMKGRCKCGKLKDDHPRKECDNFQSFKPILGCEFYICDGDPTDKENRVRQNTHLVVLAKNLRGWEDLVAATSQANHPDYFYYVPRLNLETLSKFCSGNWIAFSGHMGSHLANLVFVDYKEAYSANTYEEAKSMVHPDWITRVSKQAKQFVEIFGKDNFYLEIQLIDKDNLPASIIVSEALRYLSKKLHIPCIATPDAHYVYPEDAEDQRILLCNHPSIDTTLDEIRRKMVRGDDISLGSFFKSRQYYIPGYDDMKDIHTPEELSNTVKVADECEIYDITHKPMPPRFPLPEGITAS